MGLSLVAVLAIIATLGLMSLNQAGTVQAKSTDGSITVGTVTAPGNPQEQDDGTFLGSSHFTGRFEFTTPVALSATAQIAVIFPSKFDVDTLSEQQITRTYSDGTGGTADLAGVTPNEAENSVRVTTGTEVPVNRRIKVEFTVATNGDGSGVTVPTDEGNYTITVALIDGDEVRRGLDTETVTVQNRVPNTVMAYLMDDLSADDPDGNDEYLHEDAQTQVAVVFQLPEGQSALDVGDTITVTLNDFQGLDSADLTKENVNIFAAANRDDLMADDPVPSGALPVADVSMSGQDVTVTVPDMMPTGNVTDEGIMPDDDEGTPEADEVAIYFLYAAGIMNPPHGGVPVVEVTTSAHSKARKTNNYDEMEDPNNAGTMIPDMRNDGPVITPTMPDITDVILSSPYASMEGSPVTTGVTVRFRTDASLAADDKITLSFPEGFMLPDIIDPESVQVNGPDANTVFSDPDARLIEITLGAKVNVRNMLELSTGLLDDQGDMITVGMTSSRGSAVILRIQEDAGIMTPMLPADSTGMDYDLMLMTDKEPMDGMGSVTIMPQEAAPMVQPTGVQVMVDPDTAGSNTRLTVRFMTGLEGALVEDDEITIMAPNFGVPNSIESGAVTINGSSPKSVAVSGSEIKLTLEDPIRAERTVSVVFSETAGISNPAKAGPVEVSVATSAETMAAAMKVAIEEPPPAAMVRAIEVVPQVPGEDSRITLKFPTLMQLSSVESSEIIFRFHDNFKIEGGRIDVSKVTIQADSIDGGEVDTPEASGVENPTSATVTYETVDRKPQVRLAVPDMADDEGNQHINMNAVVTVVFQQGSGIMNPTEAEDYEIWHAVNNDANIEDNLLGMVVLPVVVSLSGDGGKRGTSVTAVAKGVEGGEAVLFWLDTETAMAGGSKTANAPDGVYDPNTEAVLCRATAESNDTATCVFEVQNPPFAPGMMLWVNVQDSEGRRVGPLSVAKDGKVGIKGAVSGGYMWDTLPGLAMHPINEAEVKLDARVTIKPSEVNIGDTVTVSMFDYASGSIHDGEIKIGGVELDLTAPGLDIRTRTSEGAGQRSFTFVIPATVVKNRGTDQEQVTPIPLGKVRVDVNVPKGAGDNTGDTNITIAGATVTLSQPNILGNQTLSISGSGFSGRGAGNNRCIEQGDVLINNVAVEIIELEDSGQCRDKIELTSSGTFTLTVLLRRENGTIPDPLQTGGTHTVVITDNKGVEGRTSIEIPDRTLDVNPKTARPRTAVTVSGRNFVADNPDGSSVAVDLKYDCGGNVRRTVSAEPDASGNFEETLRVPDDCGIPSTNTITATVVIDGTETTTETTTHDIPEAEVQVAPNQGAIGSEITITGEGFRTFEGVSSIELGTKNVLGARVFYTDRDGKLDIGPFLVPGIDPGTYALVVGVGEAEERTTASVNYTVIDEGLPQRAPVAVLEGLEPLGEKLIRVFRFNNATKM